MADRRSAAIIADFSRGAITFENQKGIYESQITQARSKGAEILTGGTFSDDRAFLKPTIVTGASIEGTATPVTVVRLVQTSVKVPSAMTLITLADPSANGTAVNMPT